MQASAQTALPFDIYFLSERALTVEFGQEINEVFLQQISSLHNLVNKNPFPGFCTAVPAYTTLSIFFNPMQVIKATDLPGLSCFEKVSNYLLKLSHKQGKDLVTESKTITIPVCYDESFGPDLAEVGNTHNLTQKEVINLHTATTYKVYMIGFVPGFAYLGGMSGLLETPRKTTPRKAIPAGSVGIAGKQTGIYPLETPGGWQLIGRTPLVLFDPESPNPALLKAGDQVTFKQISLNEFEQYGL